MSVAKNIYYNGIAALISKLVRILDQLLLIPFFLTMWGPEYYGDWLTLSIIPSILAFSDLGFGTAVASAFVLSYASGDKQKAADLCRSGFWIITASVTLGVLLTLVVISIGSFWGWFEKSAIIANEAILAVTLMMASKLIGFYSQLADAFYRSARRAATGILFGSGSCLINIVVGIGVLYAGCGVVGYALSNLIITILYTILFWIVGRRLISFDNVTGRILRQDILMIVRKGIGYLANPAWQSVYFQGTTFVVRIVLGAEAVAVFNTVRTVCRSVNQMFSLINMSIFPEIQYLYGQGNLALVRKLFSTAVVVSIIIGFCGCAILCFIGLDIYNWWTQNSFTVDISVWYMFMAGAFMNAIWWTSGVVYRMTNQPKRFAIASTTMAFISVAVCYFTSLQWGLMGAAFATTLFESCMAVFILPDSCRLLGMKLSDLMCFEKRIIWKGLNFRKRSR